MAEPRRSTAALAAFALIATLLGGGALAGFGNADSASAAVPSDDPVIDQTDAPSDQPPATGAPTPAPTEEPATDAPADSAESGTDGAAAPADAAEAPADAAEAADSESPLEAEPGEMAPMRFAEGGTGLYRGSIDWFEWGTQGTRIPAEGMTRTNTRTFAGGTLATTCTIGAPSGQGLVVQRPGTFTGDGLDDLYNVGGTGASNTLAIGLANFAAGPAVNFAFSCSASLNGVNVPLAGLVMADAEASLASTGEFVQATIPAGAQWRIIDRFRPAGCTTDASVVRTGQTLRFAGSPAHSCAAYPTGVAFMEGASSATATVNSPNGRSAIALGVALFTDFSDAPASYGDAGSVFSPPFTGTAATTAGLFAQPLSAVGQPATRLGATVTSEQAAQPSAGANADVDNAISAPGTATVRPGAAYTLPNVACTGPGFVRGWIDWNGNGGFDPAEASAPVLCAGGAVTLAWTVPADVVSGQTFLRLRIGATQNDVASATGITTAGEVEDWALEVFAPVVTCLTDTSIFNTATDGSGGVLADGARDRNWEVGLGNATGPATVASWAPAYVIPPVAGAWTPSPYGNADWISFNATGGHAGNVDAYFRYDFTIDDVVQLDGFALPMDFYADNSVPEVWVNGIAQSPLQDSLPQNPTDPYFHGGFAAGAQASTALTDGFRHGDNEIIVRVASGAPFAGFLAQVLPEPVCADFGDAPDSYGTTRDADGARHGLVDGVRLGAGIDPEADGQPNAAADGDGADEDGVTFNPSLGYVTPTIRTGLDPDSQQAVQNTVQVDASAAGFASVWVDWNQDGDFLDTGERVANAQPVTAGANDVTFAQGTNPAGTSSFVRVRYSTDAASIATPTGAAPDGEVEDYRVLVERLVQPDSCIATGTEYYAFTFAQPAAADLTGTGGVGSTARYRNVTVVGGVAVDMFVRVLAGDMREAGNGGAPPNGFHVFGDDAAWQIDPTATLRYFFYETGTTNPVEINGVFTVSDMDQSADDTITERATFAAADLAGYGVSEESSVTITQSGGNVVFTGTEPANSDPWSRFQVVLEAKSTFDVVWQGGPGSGFGFDGDGDLGIQPPACSDFGDAPNSYGTDLAGNGPRHTIVQGLTIGTQIDFDVDGQPSAGAVGDDIDRLDDEDAFASQVVLNPGVTSATLTVPITNTTGAASTLYGWIDSNSNGRFEASEFTSVPVAAGATSVDLTFASIPAMVDGATPVIRLRLTSDVLVDNTGTAAVDERALGAASNGEVEDHLAQVATLVPISCTDPFVETFGAGPGYGPPLPAGQTTYSYRNSGVVNDGMYGLVSSLPGAAGSWWHTGGDHTPDDTDGRLMLINANFTAGIFFQRTFTQLTPGATYDFSSWITNANNAGSAILPNVQFRVVDPGSGAVLASVNTGNISNKTSLVWERFALQFEATQPTVRLEMANNAPGGGGNDLAIDDVAFTPACEFGDAPDSYGTTISTDGAAHIAGGPTLGTERDTEPDGQPNAAADGDDTTGTPDDEDGVTAFVATQGRATTVTVSATNDSNVPVTLAGWLDVDGNGTFEAAERVLVSVPANSGAAEYQLTFSEATTGSDTYARFRIYGEQVADPSPTGTAGAGEVEDYLVTVLIPATLQVLKVGEDSSGDIVPMDGSRWAVFTAPIGFGAVVDPIAAATDAGGNAVTGLFRDSTLTEGAYWLEETRALGGFQLLAQRVPFTVAADGTVALGASVSVNVTLVDVDGIPTIRVEDVPALDLPDTGGVGTASIYLAGAVLLAAAGAIAAAALIRRRMSSQRVEGK